MRMILFALLLSSACATETNDIGTVYKCEGYFVCDSTIYDLSQGGGCAWDETDAVEQYSHRLKEALKQAQCTDTALVVNCVDTHKWCERRNE